MQPIAAPPGCRRIHYAAEHKPLALIEQSIAALRPEVAVVLWQKQRL